jgi:hypothetical protein
MAIGKVMAHLCLILIVKELKTIVEQGRVVTTLKNQQGCIRICFFFDTWPKVETLDHDNDLILTPTISPQSG